MADATARVRAAVLRALRPKLAAPLALWVEPVVRAALDERRQAVVLARLEVDGVRPRLRALERGTDAALARFDRRPLGPQLPIHAAHARHPGVQAIFARHGLPDCPSCPVGGDETLAEAAFSEGFDVDQLLLELRALLG